MILIIGGTGLVGSHLILECYKENLKLRVTYRSKEKLNNLKYHLKKNYLMKSCYLKSIDWVNVNLNDVVSLDDAIKGVDFVYHCAAKISLADYDKYELFKTNIEGTSNVVNICLKHKVKKLLYLSSISSIGADKDVKIINESHSWNNNRNYTLYAQSKIASELEVWRGSQEGLDVIIVNPGLILGDKLNNSSMKKIFEIAKSNFLFYPTGKIAVIGISDVSRILILLLNSSVKNERFILVSENIDQRMLSDKFRLSAGKRKAFFPLNKFLLNFFLIIEIILQTLGIRKRFMSRAIIQTLCSKQIYDGSKVSRLLSFEYKEIKSITSV